MIFNLGKMILPVWCKLLVVSLLMSVLFTHTTAALSATTIATTIAEGSTAVSNAINKFHEAEITPAIENLNQRIRALNLEAAGIPSENVTQYRQSLQEFSNVKKELGYMRVELISLSVDTIDRADNLMSLMNIAKEDPAKSKTALKFAAKSMEQLIARSTEKLDESKRTLKKINTRLSTIDSNMVVLRNKLKNHHDKIDQTITEMNIKLKSFGKGRRKRSVLFNPVHQQQSQQKYIHEKKLEIEDQLKELRKEIQDTGRLHQLAIENQHEIEDNIQRIKKDISNTQRNMYMDSYQSILGIITNLVA
jgi:chromosome segregation ATPase